MARGSSAREFRGLSPTGGTAAPGAGLPPVCVLRQVSGWQKTSYLRSLLSLTPAASAGLRHHPGGAAPHACCTPVPWALRGAGNSPACGPPAQPAHHSFSLERGCRRKLRGTVRKSQAPTILPLVGLFPPGQGGQSFKALRSWPRSHSHFLFVLGPLPPATPALAWRALEASEPTFSRPWATAELEGQSRGVSW